LPLMSSVTAKSATVKKRGLPPISHEAASNNNEEHATKYATVGRDYPHAAGMLREHDAGSLIWTPISSTVATKQIPPTVACVTAATCVEKSCPCKTQSGCLRSHVIKTLSPRNSACFTLRVVRYEYSPRAPRSLTDTATRHSILWVFLVLGSNTNTIILSARMC
jgi:hypothetical protein